MRYPSRFSWKPLFLLAFGGIVFSFFPGLLSTQQAGVTYFKNYSPEDYDEQPQNWCILQDKRGMLYVGNHGGLLEFDGVSWRLIPVLNQTVRSLAVDEKGTIYVGGENEFGFLAADAQGNMAYRSLVPYLDKGMRDFSTIWGTHATTGGVYFRTLKYLFRWDSRKIQVWLVDAPLVASAVCDGKLYIRQDGVGLVDMKGGSLRLVPAGEVFADQKIFMMVTDKPGQLLIGTRDEGFFFYSDGKVTPFQTKAFDYVRDLQLSHGIHLSGGDIALATRLGGLIISDARGRIKQVFNKGSGLEDENVKYVYEDTQGNLWLALDKGLTKIENVSPIRMYTDDFSHLPGNVLAVTRHNGDIFAGTTSGLFRMQADGRFQPVANLRGNCFSLLSSGDSLLAATSDGVFLVLGQRNTRLTRNPALVLLPGRKDPGRTWVGTSRGLVGLRQQGNGWAEEMNDEYINQEIMSIAEDRQGNLWLGTRLKGVLKVEFPVIKANAPPVFTSFIEDHGLPDGEVHVSFAAGHIMFATRKGIFRFDEKKKRFFPDKVLGEVFADGSRSVFRVLEDKEKNIWVHARFRNYRFLPDPGGSYQINQKPFQRMPDDQVNAIYSEEGGAWFAGNKGLAYYDNRVKKNYTLDFSTYIRRVLVNGKMIFSGSNSRQKTFPPISYRDRNIRIEFAAPFFEAEPATQYQCFLEDYEKGWSNWSKETRKDYTNLDAGLYTFRVRAKNVYGHLGREDSFRFKVFPPWTNTWWAFTLYGLGFSLFLFLVVRWRSWKLEQEKSKLELTVKERTKEINEKNRQLNEQSEKLKEMDKIKSRFFANISHEFRTPLTLIIGPLQQIIPACRDKDLEKKLNVMLYSSRRLLTLINQLLDLVKLDSGKLKLRATSQDIVPFIQGIVDSFQVLAGQDGIDLRFLPAEKKIVLYIDTEKLEQVMSNLLSNALKACPAKGTITVSLQRTAGESVEISVLDTGIGIPEDRLAHIFDRFYQVEDPRKSDQKGSGIGLALVKEFIDLHHGQIDVRSTEGSGTTFTVHLPLGRNHLRDDELADAQELAAGGDKAREWAALHLRRDTYEPIQGDMEEGPPGPEGEKAPGKEIILVVEDNHEVREYIRSSLEPAYRVKEAVNGQEGIDKARQIVPDLIVSDIMMPVKDGIDLCNTLKKEIKTSHIPIILLTARVSEESILQGLATGADDYVTKPFNTAILLARIKNLIDLRRQLQLKIKREMVLQPAEISVSSMDQEFLHEIQELIEKNLDDPDFSVDQLGKKLYMSRASLYRKIQALTGEAPNPFIRSYRLKRAAQLLKANYGNVTEVAFAVGFSSAAYFTKCFREEFHQLPSDFQAAGG